MDQELNLTEDQQQCINEALDKLRDVFYTHIEREAAR